MATAALKEKLELLKQQLLLDKKKTAALGVLLVVFIVVMLKTFVFTGEPETAVAESAVNLVVAPTPQEPPPVMPIPSKHCNGVTTNSGQGLIATAAAGRDGNMKSEPTKSVRVTDMPRTLERDIFTTNAWGKFDSTRGRAADGASSSSQPAQSAFWMAMAGGIRDYHMIRQKEAGEIAQELAMLQLQSTMTGASPLAYISGRLVREGAEINGFAVVRISDRRVIVRKYGQTRALAMP